jgi:xanthosine phosphorylase
MITDHINLHPGNPLVGPNDEEFGSRFFPMDDAYDLQWQQRLKAVAEQQAITLHQGVYMGVIGPCFETPAEIKAYRILGADLVGMSTVPEVIVARHCGLRVGAISVITNFASGMSAEKITHEGTLHYGKLGTEKLSRLVLAFLESLHHDPC